MRELLRLHQTTYARLWQWSDRVLEHAMLHNGLSVTEMLQMFFDSGLAEADPGTMLRLMARLSALYGEQLRELRRTAELLHRMSCPSPPMLQVVNATQITVGERTRRRPVGLGERGRARR